MKKVIVEFIRVPHIRIIKIGSYSAKLSKNENMFAFLTRRCACYIYTIGYNYFLHCVPKSVSGLTCYNFDKHKLILRIIWHKCYR